VGYRNTYPEALALIDSGALGNIDDLVTTRFKLSDINEAFETLEKGVDKEGNMVMKMMIGDY
jgi:L-iditol 2-dehydrogenase